MDILTFAIEAVFGLVFVVALIEWRRRRDALSRDVVLVFGMLVAMFVVSLLAMVTGPLPLPVSAIAVAALLGQPVATLRLAADLRPVPRPVLLVAIGAWVISTLAFTVLGTATPRLITLFASAAFVGTEIAAAAYVTGVARRRAGAAAVRLWVAAAATALFALAIVAAAASSAVGAATEAASLAGRLLALVAALGYLVAFAPPQALRRFLQAQTAYGGLRQLLAASGEPGDIWLQFLGIARVATGADSALVLTGPADGPRRIAMVSGIEPDQVGRMVAGTPGALADGETFLADGVGTAGYRDAIVAARQRGARYGQLIRLGPEPDAPSLIVFSTHRSLFGEEDSSLLSALGQQATRLVAHREGLLAHELLAAQLGDTVEALRSANEAKSDFLASMSHELRTPLNAIIGFSDLMRREEVDAGGNVTVPVEWVDHIRRGGTHLVELINDVLDLSKIEAGRLELDREPLAVRSAVLESVAGLRPLADRKAQLIEVDVPADEHVFADRGRLRQILYNLLSNAIKFTPDGGRIRVEGAARGEEFHLAVADTGVGIRPDDRAAVFEEFRQVGNVGQRTEGTGLGLALTRRMVQAHGGRIELESTPGEGSRFTVILPASAADATADRDRVAVPVALPVARPTPASVLVVEDDPSAVRLLHAYLEPEGYQVTVAANGEEALKRVRTERPAAILLDVRLPGIDGWEVLRRLKADPELRSIPVVIVTVVDEVDVGLALGAVDYIVKPIDREALLASLARLNLTPAARGRAIRILAVDDEPAALEMLTETLRPAGFDIVRAGSGMSAIQIARAERPDLVICDLVMPDLDGFGVVAALKADPATAEIPIIILTGYDLTAADKRRLNGKVMRIVAKGAEAQSGLRAWLLRNNPLGTPT